MRKREYNFDLLRFFSMVFIIINHLLNTVGLTENGNISANLTMPFFYILILCGVNLFFMLSGYFQIQYKREKLVRFIIDIYLYSGAITLLGFFSGKISNIKNGIMILINPLGNYWFMGVYLVLMFFAPILNRIVDAMDLREFIHRGLFCLVFFSIINLYIYAHFELTGGQHFLWAILMYLLGAGLKKFKNNLRLPKKKIFWGVCYLISTMLCWTCYEFFRFVLDREDIAERFFWNNCLFIVINSICLVKITEQIELPERYSKYVRFAAAHTFGVYILHSSNWMATAFRNPPIVWAEKTLPLPVLLVFIPLYAVVVFVLCAGIDQVKKLLCDPLIFKLTQRVTVVTDKIITILDNNWE